MREILVVEDDQDIRELFAEVLRDAGYVVHEAENGRVALDWLAHSREPTLVVLDVMMPVMTGPELLCELHHSNRLATLAVIAVSAGGSAADVPHADRFLRKPVHPDHLVRVVRECCARAPLSDAGPPS